MGKKLKHYVFYFVIWQLVQTTTKKLQGNKNASKSKVKKYVASLKICIYKLL